MLCGHAGRMLAPLCGLQRDDLQQRRQTVEIGHVTGANLRWVVIVSRPAAAARRSLLALPPCLWCCTS